MRNSILSVTRAWLAACAFTIAVFLPAAADAAGLGRMNVLSALGQPLNAELELNATKDELSTMQVRIAPADAERRRPLPHKVNALPHFLASRAEDLARDGTQGAYALELARDIAP